ncbi:hypothetical protein NX059_004008 [Plenodomus lindquistii]|nr:hypothetical protein NX059_004008 [Plenodomus lindquistii]
MDAHSCQHCSHIIFDLPDHVYRRDKTLESMMVFEISTVKDAVQGGCKLFQWALAVDVDLLGASNGSEYLDEHIANLPGIYTGNDLEGESSCISGSEHEDRSEGSSATPAEDEGILIDPNEDSDEIHKLCNNEADWLCEQKSIVNEICAPKTSAEAELQPAESHSVHLQLQLECYKMVPGRYRLKRDMSRSDKTSTRRRSSYDWPGPELDLVAPAGMSSSGHAANTFPECGSPHAVFY